MKRAYPSLILLYVLAASACGSPPLLWEYKAGGQVSTDVAVDGGLAYVGTSGGKLYSLNATTGIPLLNYTSTAGIYSTPAFSADKIIFGCDNSIVYALNKSTGNRTWSFLAEGMVKAPPAVEGGSVYAGTDGNYLYSLKETTGNMVWRYKLGSPVTFAPLADPWKIFLTAKGDRNVYSLSNVTGKPVWNRTLGGTPSSSPAQYKDLVYVPSSDRRLYALDKYTGQILWNFTINATIATPLTISGERIIFAGSDKKVYSISAYFGTSAWNTTLNESATAPILADNGTLYVGAGVRLYAINETTGEQLWNMSLPYQIRSRPGVSSGTLVIASGMLVRGYGSSIDLEVTNVSTDPQTPIAGRQFRIYVSVRNNGNSLAADAEVKTYVDRINLSSASVTLAPGQSAALEYNLTASYGRHIIEAVVDESNRLVESDKYNNRMGVVFATAKDWPTFKQNSNHTGYLDLSEKYLVKDLKLSWTCSLNRSNMTLANVAPLWDALNSTDYFRISSLELNSTCYTYTTRGYVTGRLNSTWSCRPYNTTGYSDRDFNMMRDYVNTFNETEYNLSMRHRALYYPFNVTDFRVLFNCSVSGQTVLPILDAALSWSCRQRIARNFTPYNVTGTWNCQPAYTSNYSLKDLAELSQYPPKSPLHERKPVNISEYSPIWTYRSTDSIQSSPIMVALSRSGNGQLQTVIGSYDRNLAAINPDGSILWQTKLNGSITAVSSADLEGDGRLEILAASADGVLTCLGSNGGILWTYRSAGPLTSAPLAVNFDATPELEVIFGSGDGNVYALDHKGTLLWNYQTADAVQSSPSAADIDGDGTAELIVGSTDNTLYAMRMPPYKVWMYSTSGDISAPLVYKPYPYSATSDIVIASGDGTVSDIYYGSAGQEDARRVCDYQGCRIITVSKTRLTARWSFKGSGPIEATPSMADVNGDGSPEFVAGSQDKNLYIINKTGDRLLRYSTSGPIRSSAALADLNGDGIPEIIFGSADGRILVINSSGETLWAYKTNGSITSSPAVADINGDGILEFAVGSDDGRLYVFGQQQETPREPTEHQTLETTTTLPPEKQQTTSTTSSTDTTSTITSPPLPEAKATTTSQTSTTAKPTPATAPEIEDPQHQLQKTNFYFLIAVIMGFYFFLIVNPPKKPRKIGLIDLQKTFIQDVKKSRHR